MMGLNRPYIALQILTASRILNAILFLATNLSELDLTHRILLSLIFLTLIELSDGFDGVIARKYGLVSAFGQAFDPYADSVSRLIIYFSLAQTGLVAFYVPLILCVRDVTVAYCRLALQSKGGDISARWGGKFKALTLAVGAYMAILLPVLLPIVSLDSDAHIQLLSIIVSLVTLGSAYEYVRDTVSL